MPLAAAQRIRNVIFGGIRAKAVWKLKIKSRRRTPKTPADEKERLIQAVAHFCGTSHTGSNTTAGQIRRIVEVLKNIHKRNPVGRNMPSGTSLPTWPSGRACPFKEKKLWPNKFGYVVLI